MFNGSNCDWKSQLSGILTEPLNPRDIHFYIEDPWPREFKYAKIFSKFWQTECVFNEN